MEPEKGKKENLATENYSGQVIDDVKKFSQSLTLKGFIIGFLSLVLLIPSFIIMSLINERERLSETKTREINKSWSAAQTICPPVLAVPYTLREISEKDGKTVLSEHTLYLVPETSETRVELQPEVRHISIYKSIVYRSEIHISGNFANLSPLSYENATLHLDRASLILGLSDLRGLTEEIAFNIDGKQTANGASAYTPVTYRGIAFAFNKNYVGDAFAFDCKISLKGSESISFVPIAKNTKVALTGNWTSPGFVGNYLPEYSIDDKSKTFTAEWNVLGFNRDIPDSWADSNIGVSEQAFGVNLTDPIDHYLLNMRAAKYALMFIALTFVVFFFVEIMTKRGIHPVQYLLVGVALILFYTLLLSLSEQIGFALAYLIAAVATVGLITAYAASIFRSRKATAILAAILVGLYTFLYTILQLEDIALLIGSIGMFLIIAVIMYVSSKIKWYKE